MHSSYQELFNRIEANSGLIMVNTYEEQKLIRELQVQFKDDSIQFWSGTQGLHEIKKDDDPNIIKVHNFEVSKCRQTPKGLLTNGTILNALDTIEDDSRKKISQEVNAAQKHIYILRDGDKFFNNPMCVRKIRDILYLASTASSSIIITAPGIKVPPELEKDAAYIELGLPETEEIKKNILEKRICNIISVHNEELENGNIEGKPLDTTFNLDQLARACGGLTEDEIINTAGYSLVKTNTLDIDTMLEEKRQIISKNDILTYWICEDGIENVGGFDELKKWFKIQMTIMDNPEAAVKFKADQPKGIMILGVQGSGKAQPLYSNILMSDNTWKPISHIEIGDLVMSPTGASSKVLEIFDHKNKNNNLIRFKDTRTAECCDEHLWYIYNKNLKRQRETSSGWKVVNTTELNKLLSRRSDTNRYYIPTPVSSNNYIDLPMDPYTLGVLIGDGCIKYNVSFSCNDKEIVNKVKLNLTDGYHVHDYTTKSVIGHRISKNINDNKENIYKSKLKSMDLWGRGSHDKFIPQIYFSAAQEQKLELLRGLMDSDGSGDGSLSFSTVSKRLCNDVINLVRSIGGMAFATPRLTKCNGKLFPSQRINIRYRNPKDLFSLSRKQNTLSDNYQYTDLKLEIVSIDSLGKEDMRCIMLDSNEHLYITDNYVVTHNTFVAKAIAKTWGKGVIKLDMGKVFAGLVGESLAPDEELTLINKDGHVIRNTIEYICQTKPQGYYTLSYRNDFVPQYKKVVDFITHERTKDLVKITTSSGRTIKVTEDHSLFTIGQNGNLMETKPSEMKIGSAIVIPCGSDENINHINNINLLELIYNYNDEDKWYVSNAYDTYGEEYLKERVTQKDMSSYRNNSRPISIDKVEYVPHNAKIRTPYSKEEFSTKIELTYNLMELFGWYTAEGSKTGESPRLHIHSNEYEEVKTLIKSCNLNEKMYKDSDSNGITIFVGGVGFGRLLTYLGLATKDRIPEWIFGTNIQHRKAFIKGFMSGDGGVSGHHIECSQSNHKLIQDIQYLLDSTGIFSSIYPRQDGGYRLCIHSSVYICKYLEEIGFTQYDKNIIGESLAIDSNSWGHKFPKYSKLVTESKELRNTTGDSNYYIDDNSNWLSYKKAYRVNCEIKDWRVHFDVVKSIEVCVDQPKYVYDISVENNENFISRGILCHNSEKRIRMALAQAEAAGGVVIIDEIDKGLAGAGSSDKTDGGTTKRVIGTLLTWMNEPHPGLFVVATANDISNILSSHPELLRKGRFDELWFSDLPTETERKSIYRIHLRKKSRTLKKFDLNALAAAQYKDASGTNYNYTGAEIEYAIKEAVSYKFAESYNSKTKPKIGSKDDISTNDILTQLAAIKPIIKVGKQNVKKMRDWAKDNARNVSSQSNKTLETKKTKKLNVFDTSSVRI